MALQLQFQQDLGGPFVGIDLAVARVGKFKLRVSDTHPAILEFDIAQPQHTFPLAIGRYVSFWDDAGTTPDGTPQSLGNPLFEGFIWEVQPAESNSIHYLCYDPSHRSAKEIVIMSTAWEPSAGPGLPPLPGLGAVPRLIFNNSIENDVDWSYERAHDLSVGQLLATVFDDALEPLRWYQAAPTADNAYVISELALFTAVPQEKVVATNENLRAFMDRLTRQYYPEYAFRWDPGSRWWRWYSRLASPSITLTLNDPHAANTVLTMELHRSLEGRYPAIEFRGPERVDIIDVSTLDGTLLITSDPTILETYTDAGGTDTVKAYTQFQVADDTHRRGARRLPSSYLVRENDYFWMATQSPCFLISFDSGVTWQGIESVFFDFQNGIVQIPDGLYPYFWSDHRLDASSSQHFWTPNAYRLIWAKYGDPIIVRRPDSGFVGTSNTVAGMTNVKYIYDEMLAVGYNRVGVPVTTATRVAQFQSLGDNLLAASKDIIYAGGCQLEGLRYEFCKLSLTVNLAAVDANGAPLITGWESLAMILTDVEYDFENQTTQLTFSQDALASFGDSIDLLKQRLQIGYVEKIRDIRINYTWRHDESKYSNKPGGYNVWSGVQYTDKDLYYDKNLGTIEEAL
ncbi:MAG: hypothetical protein JWN70_4019 [Planctomycetaceae bacterium]|nr:hypothetical protein [Planctomycetaceae bacterium]